MTSERDKGEMENTDQEYGWQVTCQDGNVRHAGLFETKSEAQTFEEWGHCCLKFHAITYRKAGK